MCYCSAFVSSSYDDQANQEFSQLVFVSVQKRLQTAIWSPIMQNLLWYLHRATCLDLSKNELLSSCLYQ